MKKVMMICVCMLTVFTFFVIAQDGMSMEKIPVADGIISDGEYDQLGMYSGMKLGASLSADGETLYIALSAPTSGWVSIGLGSLRMTGSYMVLAYDDMEEQVISEQTGRGHGHRVNSDQILIASAVKEVNRNTVLEIALPKGSLVSAGELEFILAWGRRDNLSSIHSGYATLTLSF